MNNEEMDLLRKTDRLTEENSRILKGMRSHDRIATIWKVIKWVVILIVVYYAYTILMPIYEQLQETYASINKASDAITELKVDTGNFKDNFSDFFKGE